MAVEGDLEFSNNRFRSHITLVSRSFYANFDFDFDILFLFSHETVLCLGGRVVQDGQ